MTGYPEFKVNLNLRRRIPPRSALQIFATELDWAKMKNNGLLTFLDPVSDQY
jgi:hypothetical protein